LEILKINIFPCHTHLSFQNKVVYLRIPSFLQLGEGGLVEGHSRSRSLGTKNLFPEKLGFSCPLLPSVRMVFSPQWRGRAADFPLTSSLEQEEW